VLDKYELGNSSKKMTWEEQEEMKR